MLLLYCEEFYNGIFSCLKINIEDDDSLYTRRKKLAKQFLVTDTLYAVLNILLIALSFECFFKPFMGAVNPLGQVVGLSPFEAIKIYTRGMQINGVEVAFGKIFTYIFGGFVGLTVLWHLINLLSNLGSYLSIEKTRKYNVDENGTRYNPKVTSIIASKYRHFIPMNTTIPIRKTFLTVALISLFYVLMLNLINDDEWILETIILGGWVETVTSDIFFPILICILNILFVGLVKSGRNFFRDFEKEESDFFKLLIADRQKLLKRMECFFEDFAVKKGLNSIEKFKEELKNIYDEEALKGQKETKRASKFFMKTSFWENGVDSAWTCSEELYIKYTKEANKAKIKILKKELESEYNMYLTKMASKELKQQQ